MFQMKLNFRSVAMSLVLFGVPSAFASGNWMDLGTSREIQMSYQDAQGNVVSVTPVEIVAAYDANDEEILPGEARPAVRVSARKLRDDDVSDTGEADGSGVAALFSMELGYPQVVSARLGMIIGSGDTPELVKGVLIQVEAGLNGWGGSVGYGEKGEMVGGVNGIQFLASVLYTQDWGGSKLLGIEPGQLFVGPEASIAFGVLKLSLGALFRIAGEGNSDASRVLLKAGIGIQL